MLITSRKNEKIKAIAALKHKKFRDERGEYLVEGIKMVREALGFGAEVTAIAGLKETVAEFSDCGAEIIEVSGEVLAAISDEVTPQGVTAVVKIPDGKPLGGVSVCLDGVADAGNLGTIFRTMAALGVRDAYLIGCADAYSPKTVRSSMSGIFHVNPIKTTAEDFLKSVGGRRIFVADMSGESVFSAKAEGDFCLVLGSEAHGVSQKLRAAANKTLKIPMRPEMESLNVGVSAGIMLYQLLKTRLFQE